jgi:hypothetical protein
MSETQTKNSPIDTCGACGEPWPCTVARAPGAYRSLVLAAHYVRAAVAPVPSVLRVGDTVLWRGNFGTAGAMRAKVVRIEETEYPRTKYGTEVSEILWSAVRNNYACLDLDNGSWCYGEQVSPLLGTT